MTSTVVWYWQLLQATVVTGCSRNNGKYKKTLSVDVKLGLEWESWWQLSASHRIPWLATVFLDKKTMNGSSHVTNYCVKQRSCWLAQSVGHQKGPPMNSQLTNNQLRWRHPWKSSKSSAFFKGFGRFWPRIGKKIQQKTQFPRHLFNSVSDCRFRDFRPFSVHRGKSLPLLLRWVAYNLTTSDRPELGSSGRPFGSMSRGYNRKSYHRPLWPWSLGLGPTHYYKKRQICKWVST